MLNKQRVYERHIVVVCWQTNGGVNHQKRGFKQQQFDVFLSNKQLPFNQQKCGLFQKNMWIESIESADLGAIRGYN